MKKLLLSALTLVSLCGFSQWQTTGNNTSGDVFQAFGSVFASDVNSNGLYSSADGNTWNSSNTGVPAGGLYFGTINGSTLYAYGNNSNTIYQSTSGNNWTLMSGAISASDVIKSMAAINGTVLAVTAPISGISFKIWKLVGSSWVLQQSFTGNLVACIRNLNGTLFAGTTSTCVLKSNDGGISFSNSSTGLPTTTFFDKYISALGSTSATLFCGSQFGKIFKSTNSGSTWSPVYNAGNGSNSSFINDIYVHLNNYVLVATDSGFVYSSDGGTTWGKNNAGLNYGNGEYGMTHVTVVGNYLVASVRTTTSSSSPRIMRRLITEIFPTINVKENSLSFVKSMVYPNPANANVTIAAGDLQFESNCQVSVTDVLGREIGVYKMDEGKASVSLQNFAKGLYTYRVYKENVLVSNGKLIVE